jgi:Zn-finger nucleic acid-binding protein
MRQYERSGVTIDQCSECRGIFLDRGELERLTDAENAWHSAPPPQAAPYPPQSQQYPPPGGYQQPYQHGYGRGHHKKRKSFFEELFD